MNYLHPEEENRPDTFEEHVFCNRVFARALSFLLKEKDGQSEGVVVSIDGQKYLVHATERQIKISLFDEDLPDGTFVWYHPEVKEDIKQTEEFKKHCQEKGFDEESKEAMTDYLHTRWLNDAKLKGATQDELDKLVEELKNSKNL